MSGEDEEVRSKARQLLEQQMSALIDEEVLKAGSIPLILRMRYALPGSEVYVTGGGIAAESMEEALTAFEKALDAAEERIVSNPAFESVVKELRHSFGRDRRRASGTDDGTDIGTDFAPSRQDDASSDEATGGVAVWTFSDDEEEEARPPTGSDGGMDELGHPSAFGDGDPLHDNDLEGSEVLQIAKELDDAAMPSVAERSTVRLNTFERLARVNPSEVLCDQ